MVWRQQKKSSHGKNRSQEELERLLGNDLTPEAISRLEQIAKGSPEPYWSYLAQHYLHWQTPFEQALPDHKKGKPVQTWFNAGELNLSVNCLDRHLENGRKQQNALIWIGEDGEMRSFTYQQLHEEVCKASEALCRYGVTRGDVVGIYMPILPEAVIAMLACARIGAIHCNTFWGYSASALAERLRESGAKLLITANGGLRQGQSIQLGDAVQAAIPASGPELKTVIWVNRLATKMPALARESLEWDQWINSCSGQKLVVATKLESDHPAFIVFTSGTSGRPKMVRHRLGGFSMAAHLSCKLAFGLKPKDVIWCTADIGWITSHTHVVYGPLSNGVTSVIYEGHMGDTRFRRPWTILEENQVNVWKTSPSVLRMLMARQDTKILNHKLPHLRSVLSSGEPLTSDVWQWFASYFQKTDVMLLNGWGQTETAGTLICQSPYHQNQCPLNVGRPLPGASISVKISANASDERGQVGELIVTGPWPGLEDAPELISAESPMATGDAVLKNADGSYRILGRIDDVVNIGGQRIDILEIEMAIRDHRYVKDVCVIGIPDKIKGQRLVAHVELIDATISSDLLRKELNQVIINKVSRIATPIAIEIVSQIPTTATGKIARGKLRLEQLDQLKPQEIGEDISDAAKLLHILSANREEQ